MEFYQCFEILSSKATSFKKSDVREVLQEHRRRPRNVIEQLPMTSRLKWEYFATVSENASLHKISP